MPSIKLQTRIKAGRAICFDLCRSIDLHKISTEQTNEQAVAGVVSGLIELGETVTWQAKHLGVYQKLTSVITEYNKPVLFVDELERGAFKHFRHVHYFEEDGDFTIMKDTFDYRSPFGLFGKLVDFLFLEKYMTSLLEKRNLTIKQFAENGKWKEVINIPKQVM